MAKEYRALGNAGNVRGLTQAMSARLLGYWREAEPYQRFLYLNGAALVLSGVFHFGVWLLDGSPWPGPVSWRKPILFGLSFGLTSVSMSWVLGFLPRRRVVGWVLSVALGTSLLGEVILVTMQRWRGVASHFNFQTPFDAAVFSTMGALIVVAASIILAVTIWCLTPQLTAPPSFKWAIRSGWVLLVLSQLLGHLIIQNGISKTLNFDTGAFRPEALPSAAVYGEAGAMKVPHALTLHGIQVIPLLAFLLSFAGWSEDRRTRWVLLAAAGYAGIVLVGSLQTFSGRAPFDVSLPATVLLAASVLLIVAAYTAAIWSLRRGTVSP